MWLSFKLAIMKIPLVLLLKKITCEPVYFGHRLIFWLYYTDRSFFSQLNKLTKKRSGSSVFAPAFLPDFCRFYTFCSFGENVTVFLWIRLNFLIPSFFIHILFDSALFSMLFEHYSSNLFIFFRFLRPYIFHQFSVICSAQNRTCAGCTYTQFNTHS